ncbi:hypothetical protein [Staphylococcus argenteus]|uniref:hypothetical protein n=1 Tax=Staphylococcus argenteus TaxID=985002 RepID=UPI00050268F6|nr:hypothetical protein [Staphylococcus argenteus]CDR19653.1 phage capsid and scaffold protein [Staphylococcus argenteus]
MERNESNITDVTQNEEQLDNSDEQSQQNEKTFSQEEVSQLIKERIARERKKSDERIKDARENNEVAYLLKGGKVTKVYGGQDSVSFVPGEKATELLFNSKPNTIIMLHNHPGQLGFSEYDLFTFFKHPSIKSMTIVTNKGQVKFITKSDRFQGKIVSKFCAKYFTHINIINDSHIEKLLKNFIV